MYINVIYLLYLFFRFHAKTLELYQAVCSHGNHRVANALTHHVDERLLMYCVQSESKYRYYGLIEYIALVLFGIKNYDSLEYSTSCIWHVEFELFRN
jgi:hypothetical protein